MNARENVERLISQMRDTVATRDVNKFDHISDELATFTMAAIEPSLAVADPVRLTPNESALFHALHRKMGQCIRHESLFGSMKWRNNTDGPNDDILKVQICHLRKRLKATDFVIETVWGQGYKMIKAINAKAQIAA